MGGWYPTLVVSKGAVESVMVMTLTWCVVSSLFRPSSSGSHVSVMSTLPISVSWCSPMIRRLMISAAQDKGQY